MYENNLSSNIMNLISSLNAYSLLFIGIVALFCTFKLYKSRKIGTSEDEIRAWSKTNTIALYEHLRLQGWALELAIVSLGIYSALKMDSALMITTIYMLLICGAEIVKLHVTESMFRVPRISLIILALPALAISVAMTGETILRVTDEIDSESNSEISILQDKVKDDLNQKVLMKNIVSDLRLEKDFIEANLQKSHIKKSNQEEETKLDIQIIKLEKLREKVILENNSLEKANLIRVLAEHDKSLKSIRNVIDDENDNYLLKVKNTTAFE